MVSLAIERPSPPDSWITRPLAEAGRPGPDASGKAPLGRKPVDKWATWRPPKARCRRKLLEVFRAAPLLPISSSRQVKGRKGDDLAPMLRSLTGRSPGCLDYSAHVVVAPELNADLIFMGSPGYLSPFEAFETRTRIEAPRCEAALRRRTRESSARYFFHGGMAIRQQHSRGCNYGTS